MQRPLFSLIAAFPSSLLLAYLAMHATEGWQLMVVVGFAAGFLLSWRRHSSFGLVTSYVMTTMLSTWVVWVNI